MNKTDGVRAARESESAGWDKVVPAGPQGYALAAQEFAITITIQLP
jgi:hypothetical protein